jgi:hypothetical protein
LKLQLVCDGVITIDSQNVPVCDTGWLTQIASIPFDITQIEPTVATAFFGAGFLLPIVPWGASIGVKYLLSLVR